jgi:hypothetical protein
MAGGSAPAPWVAFLCLPKEKRRKERAPPGRRRLRRFHSAHPCASPFGQPVNRLCKSAILPICPRAAFASGGAPTRRPCRGGARTRSLARPFGPALRLHASLGLTKGVFKKPVWHARASPAFARQPEGPRAGGPRVARRDRDVASRNRTAKARSAASCRAIRGVLSLVSFFTRAKKETRPRCGEPQVKTPPQAARLYSTDDTADY